jgi:hypothetical protein
VLIDICGSAPSYVSDRSNAWNTLYFDAVEELLWTDTDTPPLLTFFITKPKELICSAIPSVTLTHIRKSDVTLHLKGSTRFWSTSLNINCVRKSLGPSLKNRELH